MDDPSTAAVLTRNEQAGRYELALDGELVAVAHFVEQGELTIVPHTEVSPTRRGQGIGAVLVGAVLDDLRQRGHRVEPQCWYVQEFIDLHPEYSELLAR
ncbi:MAG: GNAT family N-acetyltransferase [Acidimicrobiales bacterium]